MSNNLYITATEARSGKSVVSLGVMEILLRNIESVGFFRPIIHAEPESGAVDNDIDLIRTHFNLPMPYEQMYGYTTSDVDKLVSAGKEGEVIEGIINKYEQLSKTCDFILCEGTDFASSSAAFEFDINAEISRNLGCAVLLVANTNQKRVDETIQAIDLALDAFSEKGCRPLAIVINRIQPKDKKTVEHRLREKDPTQEQLIYTIPNVTRLGSPTVGEVAHMLNADVLYGEEYLSRHVHHFTVAAMQIQNFLPRIEHGSLIITPGDRSDVIVACLAVAASVSIKTISGILLTGGLIPEESVWKLIKGAARKMPILTVRENTFPTATLVDKIHSTISPDDDRKITQALAVFEKNVDVEQLAEKVITFKAAIVTPKMFEYGLIQRAKAIQKHIVLPEGEEERILRASEVLLRREVAQITLLGDEQRIRDKIFQLGLQLDPLNIVNPVASDVFEDYTQTYYELRRHKGITLDNARDVMSDVGFFGTMMVYKGHADGMVSGAVHSTAATVRPAFEIIKTQPGISLVSSVFFMCLADRVLVYGDCAVNPNPDAKQLAEIAVSCAKTAHAFGIEPVVAMLSYSTGESGRGEDVDRIREATSIAMHLAKEAYPGLKIDGPIQYDAAVDASIAKTKMPGSDVAGHATVFIFPDLNTGNNTYKAVQRSADAVAVGPVLQGLKYPVNDLSRGCKIPDIVNTVAITAIQAQAEAA
jgi:phosphate acetyltransferase